MGLVLGKHSLQKSGNTPTVLESATEWVLESELVWGSVLVNNWVSHILSRVLVLDLMDVANRS